MILDRFRITDRVALVTGAGRGIGRGITEAFAEAGAHVVCAARTVDQIEEVAERVRSLGRRALAVPCDVNERAALENLVDAAMKEFGHIDILVNNAGGTGPRPALRTSERMFDGAFHFNVTTGFLLSRFVVPHMLERDGGAIVNISSAMSRFVEPGFVAYGTAKAALNHMTRLLAHELAPRVRVNAIAVGSVETDALLPFLSDDLRQKMEALTPMGRLGRTEDIALAALYLASPAASWVTGKILDVDGGLVTSNWPLDLSEIAPEPE
ncbi:MAG: SDR family oxidoreductase [Myxococcota bacterium]